MPVQFGVTEPKTAGIMEVSFLAGYITYPALSTEHLWLDALRAREPARRSAEGGDRESLLEAGTVGAAVPRVGSDTESAEAVESAADEMQKLLLLEVFELHELLQRLQELLRCMYAVRTWAHGVPKANDCAGLIVGVPNPS